MNVLRSCLTVWGEYEATGADGHQQVRSQLGRINAPRGGIGGGVPPIWVPGDVRLVRRLLARLVVDCRAGSRYADVLRARYARFEEVPAHTLCRAEKALLNVWRGQRLTVSNWCDDFSKNSETEEMEKWTGEE